MTYLVVGLGNPGETYAATRHNTGRLVLETLRRSWHWPEWQLDGKLKALTASGQLGQHKLKLVLPETFMNKSGLALRPLVKSAKQAARLVVVHDDLDLPLGKLRVSFNRGPGGHRGLVSIVKAIKTEAFVRLRVGISPVTPGGKIKKPTGEKAIVDFILGKFKPNELIVIKKISKLAAAVVATLVKDGLPAAMNRFN